MDGENTVLWETNKLHCSNDTNVINSITSVGQVAEQCGSTINMELKNKPPKYFGGKEKVNPLTRVYLHILTLE